MGDRRQQGKGVIGIKGKKDWGIKIRKNSCLIEFL
jgi:hypothetical protein